MQRVTLMLLALFSRRVASFVGPFGRSMGSRVKITMSAAELAAHEKVKADLDAGLLARIRLHVAPSFREPLRLSKKKVGC